MSPPVFTTADETGAQVWSCRGRNGATTGDELVAPFNALYKRDRTGADSTDWADEPADNSLLNGPQRFTRTNSITFLPR
jgi:hypothetical protein